jgi:hypothetical protein
MAALEDVSGRLVGLTLLSQKREIARPPQSKQGLPTQQALTGSNASETGAIHAGFEDIER